MLEDLLRVGFGVGECPGKEGAVSRRVWAISDGWLVTWRRGMGDRLVPVCESGELGRDEPLAPDAAECAYDPGIPDAPGLDGSDEGLGRAGERARLP